MGEKKIQRAMLLGHWVHSHEEDAATEMVFRPAGFDFPPSRGRVGFELRPDNSYVEIAVGPTDAPEEYHGTWEIDDSGKIRIFDERHSEPIRVMEVLYSDSERLVIKK